MKTRPAEKPRLRELKKQDKRARILSAARVLFGERGFDQTTGRQICQSAGIATGTLFLYVRDKRELLLWIFEEDARRILSRRRRDSGPPVDRWMAVLSPFLSLYARNPSLSASYVKELLFRPDRPPELVQLNQELRNAIGAATRGAQADGVLRRDLVEEEIALLVMGQYAHLVQLWLGLEALTAGQVRRRLRRGLTLLMEGLAA